LLGPPTSGTSKAPAKKLEAGGGGVMIALHEQYLVDENGNRTAVVLPVVEWAQVLDALEELDDVRAYDDARSAPSEPVPFDQAVLEIREGDGD